MRANKRLNTGIKHIHMKRLFLNFCLWPLASILIFPMYSIYFLAMLLAGRNLPSFRKIVQHIIGMYYGEKKRPLTIKIPKDTILRLNLLPYYTAHAEAEIYDASIVEVTPNNYEDTLSEIDIPDEEKEKIMEIVKGGDSVIVSEAAYTPGWKGKEKFIVIESPEKRPPKVKYFCGTSKGFPGMRFGEAVRFQGYYNRYMRLRSPLLYPMVYINRDNIDELLSELKIPEDEKKKIRGLVEDGKIIIITELAFTPEWKWKEKYLVFDRKKKKGG